MWSYHLLLQNDLITSVDNLKKNVRYDGEGEGESLDSGRQREEVFLKKLTKIGPSNKSYWQKYEILEMI